MKKVLITGVTGQDGSLMADYLLKNTRNTIIGGVRRLSVKNHNNIKHLKNNPRFKLIDLDITDQANVNKVINEIKPDYFINFAANSFVGVSWDMPVNHMETNCMAVLYQLEAIRTYCPNCRYYNAGSSEEFGDVVSVPQDESHPLRPRSPYGASKASARHLVKVWRESYNMYAVQGWLFNHEGVRRGEDFVTRKITKEVSRIYNESVNGYCPKPLELGNLDSRRDWSDAEDFVDGVWRMLNQEKYNSDWGTTRDMNKSLREWHCKNIKDYVLASGETHSIREFVEAAFACAGYGVEACRWEGEGLNERYLHGNVVLAKINKKFYRPAEVDLLFGDPSLVEKELGWKRKNSFLKLVKKMVDNDLSFVYSNLGAKEKNH